MKCLFENVIAAFGNFHCRCNNLECVIDRVYTVNIQDGKEKKCVIPRYLRVIGMVPWATFTMTMNFCGNKVNGIDYDTIAQKKSNHNRIMRFPHILIAHTLVLLVTERKLQQQYTQMQALRRGYPGSIEGC